MFDIQRLPTGRLVVTMSEEDDHESFFEFLTEESRAQAFFEAASQPGMFVISSKDAMSFLVMPQSGQHNVRRQLSTIKHDEFLLAFPAMQSVGHAAVAVANNMTIMSVVDFIHKRREHVEGLSAMFHLMRDDIQFASPTKH